MQQENLNERNLLHGPPGEGQDKRPLVLIQALNELAPGVAEACPEVVRAARRYIVLECGTELKVEALRLDALLDKCAGQGFEVDKEVFLTILEGMRAVMDSWKLESPAALDEFVQANKEVFRNLLEEGADEEDSDRRPPPGADKEEVNNSLTYPLKGS